MPSSVIRRFRYDPARRELAITFVSGKVYVYRDVPEAIVEELTAASSRGQFFNKNIRDCYAYAEVIQPVPTRTKVHRIRASARKAQSRVNSG
jgi:KTSC domain-containing protein